MKFMSPVSYDQRGTLDFYRVRELDLGVLFENIIQFIGSQFWEYFRFYSSTGEID